MRLGTNIDVKVVEHYLPSHFPAVFLFQLFSQQGRKTGYLEKQLLGRPEAGSCLQNAAFGILDVDTYIAETEVQEN